MHEQIDRRRIVLQSQAGMGLGGVRSPAFGSRGLPRYINYNQPVCASSPDGERVYVMHGSHAEKLQQHGPSCFLQTRSDASRLMAHVGMFGGVPSSLPYRRFRVGTSVPATSAGGPGCWVSMGAIFTRRDSSGGATGHLIHRVSIKNLQTSIKYRTLAYPLTA